MMSLADLTLVIPTRNRQRFALRCMRFWSDFPVRLHMLDGSDHPIAYHELSSIAPNVTYHHLPISITQRLQQGADLIETPLALLGTDDEFYIPSSLTSCVGELSRHSDLVSCVGRCLGFQVSEGRTDAWQQYTEMANYAVPQNNGLERMLFHLGTYNPSSMYSVMRTPAWKRVIGILDAREFRDAGISELQFEIAAAYLGKSKVISELMWLRSAENDRTWDTPDEVRLWQWWDDEDHRQERADLVELVAAHLAQEGVDSIPALEAAIDGALGAYAIGVRARKSRQPSRGGRRASMLRVVSRFFPKSVKTQARRSPAWRAAIRLGLASPAKRTLIAAAADLERTGVVVDYRQLELIERAILLSHQEHSRTAADAAVA